MQLAIPDVGVSTFRGSFADLEAALVIEDEVASVEASAVVDSISIGEPPEFPDHVVRGSDYFAADARARLGRESQRPSRAYEKPLMRLLAISGSLRRRSYNSGLLDSAAAESGRDVELVFWNHLDRIPAYNEDAETQQPESVAVLKDEIPRADAVLFATPKYNGSIPASLKNTLDRVSRPFADNPLRDKPVVVVGASQGGFGATGPKRSFARSCRR